MSDHKSRNDTIDLLKGIAILWVIACHFCMYIETPSYITKVFSIGASFPQLFFVISIYFLWRQLERKEICYVKYLKQKLLRLAPVYYTTLIISVLACGLSFSFCSLFWHLSMLNALVPQYSNNILRVEWYVSDLFIFMLMAPLLHRYVNNKCKSWYFLSCSFFVSAIWTLLYNNTFHCILSPNGEFDVFYHTFFFPNQLPTYAAGILCFYLIKDNTLSMINKAFNVAIPFICVLTIVMVCGKNVILPIDPLKGLFFALLFILSVEYTKERIVKIPILCSCGRNSYGMYLIHITLLICGAQYVPVLNGGGNLLMLVIIFSLLCFVSWMYGWLMERITRLIINFFDNKL